MIGGYDQKTAIPSRHRRVDDRLELTKDSGDSCYLAVPWPLEGLGTPLCTSATLRERPEPYHLLIELARGELNHVRTQTAEWEAIGFTLDPGDRQELHATTALFSRLVTDASDQQGGALAEEIVHRALGLSDRIARTFATQLLHTRLHESGRPETRLGCRLASVPPEPLQPVVPATFNALRLVPNWRRIEPNESQYDWEEFDALVDWAVESGLEVSIGPIIDLGADTLPEWLQQWHGDLPSLAAFTCDFAETLLRRYASRVQHWEVFGGFNHTDAAGLDEDDRIRLAARLLDSVRQTINSAEGIIGLAQPWGDYLISEAYTYSPLMFADTLARAGFPISAVNLELLWGSPLRGSHVRDPLDVYRLLDLFSLLGLPLEVTIGAPLSGGPSEEMGVGHPPLSWVATSLALAIALPQVRGVYWDWTQLPSISTASSETSSLPAGLLSFLQDARHQFLT